MARRRRIRRLDALVLAAPVVLGSVVAGCGDDGGRATGTSLSAAAESGRDISRDEGCAACHGRDGQGGIGPTWTGLAESTVELDDGRAVTADTAYLTRAIVDPSAEKVDGYAVEMPVNDLSDAEIASVIAYIEELSP